MATSQLYDEIGTTYTATRRTDPRIAAQVWAALGEARTVVNLGAGTGSYEPTDREVLAVEPSAVMRSQRPVGSAPCVGAFAAQLPFADKAFDAAMAVATIHHWPDPSAGLREMQRVAERVVVFTYDLDVLSDFWLTRDYLPEAVSLLADLPSLDEYAALLGARTEPVLIPWDCTDGFYEAYWRRPEAYLTQPVRRGISVLSRLGRDVEDRMVRELSADLADGSWHTRNADLLASETADLGLRLLVA